MRTAAWTLAQETTNQYVPVAGYDRLAVVECLLEEDCVDPSVGRQLRSPVVCHSEQSCCGTAAAGGRSHGPQRGDKNARRLAARNSHFDVIERLLEGDRVDPGAVLSAAAYKLIPAGGPAPIAGPAQPKEPAGAAEDASKNLSQV